MRRRTLLATAIAALVLAACSPAAPPLAAGPPPALTPEYFAEQGHGFSVGSLVSTQVVYVFFDTQCPHCENLWRLSRPLHANVRFVWMPAAVLGRASLAQGAALLAAADPVARMDEHARASAAGGGGLSAIGSPDKAAAAKVEANTERMRVLGLRSVPYLVTRHRVTGELVTQAGVGDLATLAHLIGVAVP